MKKLMILCCFSLIILSCQKEVVVTDLDESHEATVRKSRTTTGSTSTQYDQFVAKRDTPVFRKVSTCAIDPEDFQECEITFKVLCIDDCGENLMENGEVWVSFEYNHYSATTANNLAYTKNNWSNSVLGGASLQIGQEYTLQYPVIASEDCPLYISGEMWGPGNEYLVGGTIYLEINGAEYYPIDIWNIPHCTTLGAGDVWPDPITNFVPATVDENCFVSGRVNYVQDPCNNVSSF